MPDLQTRTVDKDLIVLEELVDDLIFPQRNWKALIEIYNQNNSKFPIPATYCAYIIEKVKDGQIPKKVFQEKGISYTNFNNRYNKDKILIEELSSKSTLTDQDWQFIQTFRNDPFFILGQDIERARAYNFNQSTEKLKELGEMGKFTDYLEYVKQIHKEEFEQREESHRNEIVIQFAPGILEAI